MPEKSRDNKIGFHVNLHPFFISTFQIDGLNVIFNDFIITLARSQAF